MAKKKTEKTEAEILAEKAKELQREYNRRYRQENPEKIREIRRRYWERKAKEALEAEAAAKAKEVASDG